GEGRRVDTRAVAARLERFRTVLQGLLDNLQFTSPMPTYVFAFRDQESFAPFAHATGSENVAGFFSSAGEANYIALNMGAGRAPESIVYHEYVHYLSRRTTRWCRSG